MMRPDNPYPGREPVYITKAFGLYNVGDMIYPPAMERDRLMRLGLVQLADTQPEPVKRSRGRPRKAD
jgi:hypothetical protein